MDTLNVSQAILKNALADVSKAVSPRTTLPILEFILFKKIDDKTLSLSGTNLEMAITANVLASFTGEFKDICLPSKTINELVGTFPNDTVSISVDPKTMVAKISSGNSKSTVKGIDAMEFPPIHYDIVGSISLPNKFPDAVNKVVIASSSDEARPVLSGVFIELKKGKIVLSAADGFRLSRMSLDIEYDGENISVIVPALAMKEYARMAKNVPSSILIEKSKVVFKIGDTVLMSQLIDGSYPDLSQVIPTKFQTTVVVKPALLKNAVRQARIFSRDGNSSTTLRVEKDNIVIEGKSEETGQTSTTIEADVNGEPLSIAFNTVYVADGVNAINEDITIKLIGNTSPGMFSGADDYVYVVMPMMME